LVRRSAFVALGAALGLAAAAAPVGAQVIPGLPLPASEPTTTTTASPTAAPRAAKAPAPDPGHEDHGHGHDGHHRKDHGGKDHQGDPHRDRNDGHHDDAHHERAHVSPTTIEAGPQPRQVGASRAQLALTSTTTAARRELAHSGEHAVASAGAAASATATATATSTTRPRPTTVPSTAAARLDRVKSVSAQGINASLRHNRSTTLDGELVSRRVASPITAGFVALAILVLLLDGGRRRTRGSRSR
jgi:hypothetical protein